MERRYERVESRSSQKHLEGERRAAAGRWGLGRAAAQRSRLLAGSTVDGRVKEVPGASRKASVFSRDRDKEKEDGEKRSSSGAGRGKAMGERGTDVRRRGGDGRGTPEARVGWGEETWEEREREREAQERQEREDRRGRTGERDAGQERRCEQKPKM